MDWEFRWASGDVIVAASNAGWIGHCFKDYETLVKGNIKGKLDLLFSANAGERDKMQTSTSELDQWIKKIVKRRYLNINLIYGIIVKVENKHF